MGPIAEASKQQAAGIGEISEGMKQIDTITQNNAAGSQEMASAAQDLSLQAQGLQDILGRFRTKADGGAAAPVAEESFEGADYEVPIDLDMPVGSGW